MAIIDKIKITDNDNNNLMYEHILRKVSFTEYYVINLQDKIYL